MGVVARTVYLSEPSGALHSSCLSSTSCQKLLTFASILSPTNLSILILQQDGDNGTRSDHDEKQGQVPCGHRPNL
jgi:hypothetical protein